MKGLAIGAISTLVLAGLTWAQAQSDPLIKQTFKDSQGGWVTFGPTAMLSLTHDSPVVAPGEGALKFGYGVSKGEINALAFPVQLGTITRAKSIKFRVRTDTTTVMAVMLQEQDGGRYVATFLAPKDAWQPIELATEDFKLSDGKDDPKDPDGKLDMDRVSGITVVDLAEMFAQSDNTALNTLIGVRSGSHTLYVDDFTVGVDPIPTTVSTANGEVTLDTFAHPQLAWFGIGGMVLERSTGKPLDGMALKCVYHQTPNQISALVHGIAAGTLTGTRSLSMDFASIQPCKLLVQLEETDGEKFNALIDLPGGSEPKNINLPFSAFKVADDSTDPNGKLDVAKVKTLLVIDSSGPLQQADHDNTLWLNQVVAHK